MLNSIIPLISSILDPAFSYVLLPCMAAAFLLCVLYLIIRIMRGY